MHKLYHSLMNSAVTASFGVEKTSYLVKEQGAHGVQAPYARNVKESKMPPAFPQDLLFVCIMEMVGTNRVPA